MTDETQDPKPEIDLTKRPCGSIGRGKYDGQPVEAFLYDTCYRAGIERGDHPIYPAEGFLHWRLGDPAVCDRLPAPFPPADYGDIDTVQEALDCVASCKVPNALPPTEKPVAPKWDADLGEWIHTPGGQPVPVALPTVVKPAKIVDAPPATPE